MRENKASNEHLTKSYTKPQLTLPPNLAPYSHAHTCRPLPMPWRRKEEKRASVWKRRVPLHLGKGLHHRVISGKVTPFLPSPWSYVPARKRFRTIVRKVRGCFGFSLFIGSRHHYPPVSISSWQCSLVEPGKRMRQRMVGKL